MRQITIHFREADNINTSIITRDATGDTFIGAAYKKYNTIEEATQQFDGEFQVKHYGGVAIASGVVSD